jgi:hypothetical protein
LGEVQQSHCPPRALYLDGIDGGHALWDLGTMPAYQRSKKPVSIPKVRVFAVALDDLFPNPAPDSIRALKIDVEGAAMEVLRGGQRLLSLARIPVVICECHRERLAFAGSSESMMRDFMSSLGYDAYVDTHTSDSLIPLAPGKTLNLKSIFNLVFVKPEYRVLAAPPGSARNPAAHPESRNVGSALKAATPA